MKTQKNNFKRPHISIAPMMAWTDRHCRYFHRLISPNSVAYSEMVTTGALRFGDQPRHLDYSNQEHPIALQLGGNNPEDLAFSAKLGEDWGYDEVNLNCGCPSDRVQNGAFGACLMNEPDLVAACVHKMNGAVDIPVTVKCRIGIDDSEDYEFLNKFIKTVADAGCETFVIHARKAWLKGLSPKENREIPPLKYDVVYRIKQEHPHLNIIINGGITTCEETKAHLTHCDGVMIGREAYQNPYILADIEAAIFGHNSPSRDAVALQMHEYIQDNDCSPHSVVRHMMGLYKAQKGGRVWRQTLSDYAQDPNVINIALDKMKNV